MRLLDLFCGAGGAAMGYQRAGFYVVGVDIQPQPRYCGDEFLQMDAMDYLAAVRLSKTFDAIHASPPCQKYSWAARRWRDVERVDLMPAILERFRPLKMPWIVENVSGAPFRHAIRLCGTQFGLELIRHRLFESNVVLLAHGAPCTHKGSVRGGDYITVAGHGGENAKGRGSRAVKQQAMGIDWMNDQELNEAIPPAYTEYIGKQLLQAIER